MTDREDQKFRLHLSKIGKIAKQAPPGMHQSQSQLSAQKLADDRRSQDYLRKKYPEEFADEEKSTRFFLSNPQEVNYRINPLGTFDESVLFDLQSELSEEKRQKRSKTLNIPKFEARQQDFFEQLVEDLLVYGKEKHSRVGCAHPREELHFLLKMNLDDLEDSAHREKLGAPEHLFSYWQSLRRIREGKFLEAIEFCKKSLAGEPHNERCIFNLGMLYLATHRYELSKKWLLLALKCNRVSKDTVYGIALCALRLQKPLQTQLYLEGLVEKDLLVYLPEKSDLYPFRHILYLYLIACRIAGLDERCAPIYRRYIQLCTPKNYQILKTLMFTIAFKRLRGYQVTLDPQLFSDCETLIRQLAAQSSEPRPLLSHPLPQNLQQQQQQHGGNGQAPVRWLQDFGAGETRQKAQSLQRLRFFDRFSARDLEQMLDLSQLRVLENFAVLTPKKDTAFVIVHGTCIVYDHCAQFDEPQIVNFYQTGDVIGDHRLDDSLFCRPEIWAQVTSRELELLELPLHVFRNFWMTMRDSNRKRLRNLEFILKKVPLFSGLPEASLLKLCFDIAETASFKLGDIIFSQGDDLPRTKINIRKEESGTERAPAQLSQQKTSNKKTNKSGQLFEPIHTRGFYVIMDGKADLQTYEGLMEFKLVPGDFFGENLLFDTESITRFGRIKASSATCECLFLPKEKFGLLNSFDRNRIRQNIQETGRFHEIDSRIKT